MNETIAEYTIRQTSYGILLFGPIPSMLFCNLLQLYADHYNYDLIDLRIAQHFDATSCLTTKELSKLWRNELGLIV